MTSARESKVYKDIWVNHILPTMDIKSLLQFSAVSHEARQAAFAELFKRDRFSSRINNLISEDPITDHNHYEYLRSNAYYGETFELSMLRIMQVLLVLCISYGTWSIATSPREQQQMVLELLSSIVFGFADSIFMFNEHNKPALEKWQKELAVVARNEERSERFKYLRDQLPKESITNHTIFRQFTDTSEKHEYQSNSAAAYPECITAMQHVPTSNN